MQMRSALVLVVGLLVGPVLLAQAPDVTLTKTDGVTTLLQGTSTTYTIVVSNNDPSPHSVLVHDEFGGFVLPSVSWTCVATASSTCGDAGGTGVIIHSTVVLAPGGRATFTATATLQPELVGEIVNSVDGANPGDGIFLTATDVNTVIPRSFSITKNDGTDTFLQGTGTSYLIVVTNNDPVPITLEVSDPLPVFVTSATWECVKSGGASCGSGITAINTTVSLGAHESATFTLFVQLAPLITGPFANTAFVRWPEIQNSLPLSATDTDQVVPRSYSITKTDNVTSFLQGTGTTYTIVVTNNDPAPITLHVQDPLLPTVLSAQWTCLASGGASCGSGSGGISTNVDLAGDDFVTFTQEITMNPVVTGPFVNEVFAAWGGDGSRTTASDTDVILSKNFSLTKTDNATAVGFGTSTTYTIVVTNHEPAPLTLDVTDTFPAAVGSVSWTCAATPGSSCGAGNGSGNLATSVTLASGGVATFTAAASLSSTFTGTLTNTASAAYGSEILPATDVTEVVGPDLSITKSNGVSEVAAGSDTTYTLVVTNEGAFAVDSIEIADSLPAQAASMSWTCAASPGSVCGAPSGEGALSTTVNLVPAGTATFQVTVALAASASGVFQNTATATAGGLVIMAVDTDAITISADVSITKQAPGTTTPGFPIRYSIVVTNEGPSDAANVVMTDELPPGTTFVSIAEEAPFDCVTPAVGASGTVTCTAVVLPPGSITIELVVQPSGLVVGSEVTNTVTVTSDTPDPSGTNGTASAVVALVPAQIPVAGGPGLLLLGALLALSAVVVIGRLR